MPSDMGLMRPLGPEVRFFFELSTYRVQESFMFLYQSPTGFADPQGTKR